MFSRERARRRGPNALGRTRDLVEIIAIVAAGIWALYIFVYENRIKPAHEPANLEFKATLSRLSQRDGLIAVRLDTVTRNLGATRVQFLGFSYYVEGVRVFPSHVPTNPANSRTRSIMYAGYRYSAPRVVWRTAYVTHVGNPAESADLFLDAGNADERDFLFYVKARQFDQLTAWVDAIYTRSAARRIPTAMIISSSGVPSFSSQGNDYERSSTVLTHLDLMTQ
jgi:hypothetical protein